MPTINLKLTIEMKRNWIMRDATEVLILGIIFSLPFIVEIIKGF